MFLRDFLQISTKSSSFQWDVGCWQTCTSELACAQCPAVLFTGRGLWIVPRMEGAVKKGEASLWNAQDRGNLPEISILSLENGLVRTLQVPSTVFHT